MVMDGLKDQTFGNFRNEFQDSTWQINQTETHSSWKNSSESYIRDLEKFLVERWLYFVI